MDDKNLAILLSGNTLKDKSKELSQLLNKDLELGYVNLLPNGNLEVKILITEKRVKYNAVTLTFSNILSALKDDQPLERNVLISGDQVFIKMSDLLKIVDELAQWFKEKLNLESLESLIDFLNKLEESEKLVVEITNDKKLEMRIPLDYYRSDTYGNKSLKLMLDNNPVLVDMEHYFNLWLNNKIEFENKKKENIVIENLDVDR